MQHFIDWKVVLNSRTRVKRTHGISWWQLEFPQSSMAWFAINMESNEHSHEDITNQCSRPYTAVLIQCDSVINSIQTYSQMTCRISMNHCTCASLSAPQTKWYTLSPMGLITKKVGGKCMTEVPSHDLSSPHCERSRPKTEVLKQLTVSSLTKTTCIFRLVWSWSEDQ